MFAATAANAQSEDSYLYFNTGGGIHNLNFKLTDNSKKAGAGFMAEFGFGDYFHEQFGFTAGLKFMTASVSTQMNFNETLTSVPDPNLLLDQKVKSVTIEYTGLKEKTNESALLVPVGLTFRQDLGVLVFESRLFFEAGMVVQQKYKTKSGSMNVSSSFKNTFDGIAVETDGLSGMTEYGTGNLDKQSGNPDMKKFFMGAGLNCGVLYPISKQLSVAANVYSSLSFINQNNADNPYIYDGEKYHGVAQSAMCEKIRPYTVGLAVGVRYKLMK